jgi:hypothetical protein
MKRIFISDKIKGRKSSICSSEGVFAKNYIKKGEMLVDAEADIIKKPNALTLQIGESEYLYARYIDNIINHSCNPNVFVRLYKNNKKRYSYIALKNIKKDQELLWNYNTNDWDVAKDFVFTCNCNSKTCARIIRGMKYLTKSQQKKLLPIVLPFIRKKLAIIGIRSNL